MTIVSIAPVLSASITYGSCNTESVIPATVAYVYLSFATVLLLIVSIWAATKFEPQEISGKNCQRIKSWFNLVHSKKSCYFPAFAQIFDQVTDIGTIVEFYKLSQIELKLNTKTYDYCGGVNTLYLFYCSLAAFILYRLISSFMILYRSHKGGTYKLNQMKHYLDEISVVSWCRILLQLLFDGELYFAMKTNWQCKNSSPSNPQIFIQTLEAMIESSPQILIQSFFILRTTLFGARYNYFITIC